MTRMQAEQRAFQCNGKDRTATYAAEQKDGVWIVRKYPKTGAKQA